MSETLPKTISVSMTAEYDVVGIIEFLVDTGTVTHESVTLDDVIKEISSRAEEDLSCSWGHTVDVGMADWRDGEGNAL